MRTLRKSELLLVLAASVSAIGACGEAPDQEGSARQSLTTFWTGNHVTNWSIPATPGCMGARQIEFKKARALFGSDYYDYAYSDIRGLNAPDGAFGPFISSPVSWLTMQTLFCSQTSDASLGVRMAPLPGILPGWIFSTQKMSCRLITYWNNGPPTTMFLTIPAGGIVVNSTGTMYNLAGAANPSLGWCGNDSITITGE